MFSGYSFYESVLKAPALAVYVPPQIAYTDPDRPESPFEVFILPLTLANDGARAGTVLSIDLEVTNPRSGQTKTFYAAHFGSWGTQPAKAFTPVALSGKASFSGAVQFLPRDEERVARILESEPGQYDFKVTLNTAAPKRDTLFDIPTAAKPLTFKMQADSIDYRYFNNFGTMPLRAADYKPAASE